MENNKETKIEEQTDSSCLGAVRRSYSYEELAEHWKFCGQIFKLIEDRNENSNSPMEREATKFAGECVVVIMDDLKSLLDG